MEPPACLHRLVALERCAWFFSSRARRRCSSSRGATTSAGFNSAAPRAAPLADPKGPVSVTFCPRRAVIAASFAFGASQLLPAKRAVALRPKKRQVAAAPTAELAYGFPTRRRR